MTRPSGGERRATGSSEPRGRLPLRSAWSTSARSRLRLLLGGCAAWTLSGAGCPRSKGGEVRGCTVPGSARSESSVHREQLPPDSGRSWTSCHPVAVDPPPPHRVAGRRGCQDPARLGNGAICRYGRRWWRAAKTVRPVVPYGPRRDSRRRLCLSPTRGRESNRGGW